jgi:amidase
MRWFQTCLGRSSSVARGLFVVPLVLLVCALPLNADEPDDLAYLGIKELQKRMESGSLTAVELVSFHVRRIAEIDRAGPGLGAVIEINPDAFAIAAELDRERQKQGPRGPMHGIPILLKANIDTGDKMDTTAGSLALKGTKAPDDAFHVKALRDAGAIILGKANLSEWANFRSSNSSSGWSSIGGQARNPYALDRSPCGSSSGSAVAVAAGMSVVAIGTETDGSVVCPAGVNGVVGIKPTVGLVSRDGIIPIAHTQDTAGPMARSVEDAAIVLTAMAIHDNTDSAAEDHPGVKDYSAELAADGLKGARIGVWRGYEGAEESPRITRIFDNAVEAMQRNGAIVVDPVELELTEESYDAEFEVLLFEFNTDLNAYLAAAGADPDVDTLAEIIEFNRKHSEDVMPWFAQELFEIAEAKGSLDDPDYLAALEKSHVRVSKLIDAVMKKHNLDAIVAPTNGPTWNIDWVSGDRFSVSSSSPAAISGYPAITIPMGEIHGLPIGISFFGLPYTEAELIALAFGLEQRLPAMDHPTFPETLEAHPE